MTIHDERDVYIEQDPTPPMGTDLSAVQAAVAEPIEGELLTPAENAEIDRRQARTAIVRRLPALPEVQVVKARAAGPTKAVGRHLSYPVAGVGIVWGRWRDSHGGNRYERMMRAAEVAGEHDKLLEWETRDVEEKQRRHERTMDWIKSPLELVKAAALGVAGVTGLLLVIGVVLAIGNKDIADVIAPITAIIDAIAFAIWFVSAYGAILLLVGTAAAVGYLHQQGRKHGETPTWCQAQSTGTDTPSADLDESMIMTALRNLGHSALNRKFKEGWGSSVMPTWVQPPLPVGHGWEFALRLPGGVPATSINARKSVLAHNLGRRPEEVWVEVDDTDPMAMKCLVLDPGALRLPVPDYPLVESGQTDFWTGFPVGIDARRNPVMTSVFERNFVKAGIMGSGKSTLLQTEVAGAVLDPAVEIDVFCFAENNDWEWLRPVAATISMGDTAANVEACIAHIEALHDSLAERGRLLREYDIDSLTRAAAEKDARLRPRLVVIDECQSLFRQDNAAERRELVNLVVRFYSAARKYGIVLSLATPTPSDQSLPRDLVAVTTNKSCFAIGDKARNNVVLGEKAYENGLSALELKPAVKEGGKIVALNDVGTSISVGYTTEPGVLRSYNLTSDQKARIVERGVEMRGGARGAAGGPVEAQQRDLLVDVAAVLTPGEDKTKAADVCARLRELAPDYRPYTGLKAEGLRDQLAEHGCKVSKVSVLTVFTERVRDALAAREQGNN